MLYLHLKQCSLMGGSYASPMDIRKEPNSINPRNLKVVYKMTQQVYPRHLDRTLEQNGYILEGLTSVQVYPLNELETPSLHHVELFTELTDKWFSNFCILNKVSKTNQSTLKQMLLNIIPKTCFILLRNEEKDVLACGLGVLEGEYIGLFDIVSNVNYRNQGFGKQFILTILQWGKENGAKQAYLQVVLDNMPAINLYRKLGFEERYRYWYRIKN